MKLALSLIMISLVVISAFSLFTFEASSNPVNEFEMGSLIETPYADRGPSLFQDLTGKIWVFYASRSDSYPYSRKSIFYITSTDMGNTWSDEAELMPTHEDGPELDPSAGGPCAFEDSTGKIWVAWQRWTAPGISDVYYTTSTDGGITWSTREVLVAYPGDDNNGCFIEVEGQVWYIFCPYYLSSWDVHYMKWNGTIWSDPYAITSDSEPHHYGAGAIVDSRGTIWVTYERGYGGGSGDEDIWYKTSPDNGATWSPAQQITFTAGSENQPRIVEYSGTIYIFYWTGEESPTRDIWYLTSEDYGSAWSGPRQLTTDPNMDNHVWASQIGMQLWAVWRTDRSGNHDIWLAKTSGATKATVETDPDTLNLGSKGKWITAYIELPEGYDVADINVSTILLNDTIPVDSEAPTAIGDCDGDGIPDLMVKFSRTDVITLMLSSIDPSEFEYQKPPFFIERELTVTGQLDDGTAFEGSDTLRIIFKCAIII